MKTTKSLLLAVAATLTLGKINAQVSFTKMAVDTGYNYASTTWLDIDNDGFLDLLVANGVASSGDSNVLYRNNGNGSFSQITSGPLPTDVGYSVSVAGGDYDNDGLPDLFFGGAFGPTATVSGLLYHNLGGGSFEQINDGVLAKTKGNIIASWVDYDNDGLLDIFLANTGGPNFLFRNQGDGSFATVKPAIPTHPSGGNLVNGSVWADYDNDGFADVFIYGGIGHNLLFHNNHDGTFTQVHGAPFDTDSGPSGSAVWADYDNDGFLDLFVATGGFDNIQRRNYLYHNNGDGTFTKVTTGAIATDLSYSVGAGWEDFDNDGNLDLFISQSTGPNGSAVNNLLYHNNGDGTFTPLTNTLTTADSGNFAGISWGDYNNDGFPDLFVAAGEPSYIYHNEGNTNRWISFRLVGTQSNRSAIGAKVRVKATIRGKSYWQMRYVSSDGLNSNSLNPHFGLGDATFAETVRIEWPSGAVQQFQNVAANHFMNVTEPSRLTIGSSTDFSQIILKGGRGLQYDLQTGADLVHWSLLTTIASTNLDGTAVINQPNVPGASQLFYRAALH